MQVLFLTFRRGVVVQIDLMQDASSYDLNATARLLLKERCNEVDDQPDCCRGYLLQNNRLVLALEEMA